MTLRLRCSEKSIAPLFKGTIYSSEENPSAGFNMLLVVETANSDRPPTGFCNELLIALLFEKKCGKQRFYAHILAATVVRSATSILESLL